MGYTRREGQQGTVLAGNCGGDFYTVLLHTRKPMVGFSYQVVVLIHWLSILALNWDFFFFFNFILFLNFTILYWFCQILKWIRHRYTCVPHPEPSFLLPPHTIPLGRPSAPAPSIQYRALNLDWRLNWISYRDFQSHSSLDTTRRNSAELFSSGILTLLFLGYLLIMLFLIPQVILCVGVEAHWS